MKKYYFTFGVGQVLGRYYVCFEIEDSDNAMWVSRQKNEQCFWK